MSDLKPCPFCEAALVWSDTYSEYHHPIAKCILSGHKFKKGMIGQWNRRALPAAQPDPREAALRDIARQKRTDEMDTEYDVEYADFEGGYNAIIDVARRVLPAVHTGKEVMPDVPHDAPNAPDAAPASTDDAGGGAVKMALCDAIMTGMGVLRVTHVDAMREEVAEALWIANRNGCDAQLRPRFADIESYNRNHWLKLADVAIEKIKGEKK